MKCGLIITAIILLLMSVISYKPIKNNKILSKFILNNDKRMYPLIPLTNYRTNLPMRYYYHTIILEIIVGCFHPQGLKEMSVRYSKQI